jgi:hypothetical protein
MRTWLLAVAVEQTSCGAHGSAPRYDQLFTLVGMDPLTAPGRGIWQCLGMVIGVYGVGYFIASRDPVRHWPIVFVGLLGKIFWPHRLHLDRVARRDPVGLRLHDPDERSPLVDSVRADAARGVEALSAAAPFRARASTPATRPTRRA